MLLKDALVESKKSCNAFGFSRPPKKTALVTDGWKATLSAVKEFKEENGWGDKELWHEIVNHSAGEIVNVNGLTTNHIEN